ncbi:hypothetical protein WR25_22282 [Diploscapter pachys]|uniref:SXP/RAL-2 family protein Ani s 5-like cation-binding domain-containing protein n=1 Tax=Diploscapter pachys TaxID=2018661 RepID=A0A2A2L5K0_9BILA|nr:hypothetical protein WR25_22282 [Diploscapter pachys]
MIRTIFVFVFIAVGAALGQDEETAESTSGCTLPGQYSSWVAGLNVTTEAQQELCIIIANAVMNSITIGEFKKEMTAWGEKYGTQDKIAAFNKRGDEQVSTVIQDAIRVSGLLANSIQKVQEIWADDNVTFQQKFSNLYNYFISLDPRLERTLYATVSEIIPSFIKELLLNPPAQEKQTSETPEPEV